MVGGFDGANSFFSLFYAFEYWWSSDLTSRLTSSMRT